MSELKIQKYYLKNNRCYKQAQKRTPIGIQIHTIGCAQGTAKAVADYWNQVSISAAVTFICDADVGGNVLQTLPEDYYTWADAGYGNRNLITIEVCESDFMTYAGGATYRITDLDRFKADVLRGYRTAVLLCIDICKRYGWNPMSKLPSGLYLISSHDEGRRAGLSSAHVDPAHLWPKVGLSMDQFRKDVAEGLAGNLPDVVPSEIKWFRVRKAWTDVSSQLGAYEVKENAINQCPYGYSVFDSEGKAVYTNKTRPKGGTQASEFANLSESVAAEKILDIVYNCDKSGILPSVSAAQFILESGYGKTHLCKIANNCFGMKASLSGNTWASAWDGKSTVTVPTQEEVNGRMITIEAPFRKYPDIETSIRDHSAYLLGAMNGSVKRYAGLLDAKDYKSAITLIKKGGYATDSKYVSKICSIIERYNLSRYDAVIDVRPAPDPAPAPTPAPSKKTYHRVQIGLYKLKGNAEKRAVSVKAATGFPTAIQKVGLQYQVICGSFESEKNAKAREKLLKNKYNVDCCIKEVQI